MKRILFTLFVVAASLINVCVKAQSNTLLVYGNVGFDSQKAGGTTSTSYSFAPGVGYQWNNNWTGGINLALSGSNDAGKTSSVAVGPFIRYTKPLNETFAVYGQFNANYLSGDNGTSHYSGFQGTIFPAIGVNLKNSFALNFNFGAISFTSQTFNSRSEPSTSDLHIAFGSGVGFGISKNFGLRK